MPTGCSCSSLGELAHIGRNRSAADVPLRLALESLEAARRAEEIGAAQSVRTRWAIPLLCMASPLAGRLSCCTRPRLTRRGSSTTHRYWPAIELRCAGEGSSSPWLPCCSRPCSPSSWAATPAQSRPARRRPCPHGCWSGHGSTSPVCEDVQRSSTSGRAGAAHASRRRHSSRGSPTSCTAARRSSASTGPIAQHPHPWIENASPEQLIRAEVRRALALDGVPQTGGEVEVQCCWREDQYSPPVALGQQDRGDRQ